MEGHLHAAALIGLPVATLTFCAVFVSRTLSWRRVGVGVALFVAVLVIPAHGHLCGEGQPVNQLLISALCLFAAVVVARGKGLASVAAVFIIASAFVLSWLYEEMIHDPQWSGNPAWHERVNEVRASSAFRTIGEDLRRLGQDDQKDRPAGWIGKSDLWEKLGDDARRSDPVPQRHTRPAWHTSITRLWHEEPAEARIWYPGGAPSEAADRLELRPADER